MVARRRDATTLGLASIKMHVCFFMDNCGHILERTSLGVDLGPFQNTHLKGKTGLKREFGDEKLNSWGMTVLFECVTAQIEYISLSQERTTLKSLVSKECTKVLERRG